MEENRTKKYLAKQVQNAEKREAFEEQIKQQLRTEERFVNYFKQFDPSYVDRFIEHYAIKKAGWYQSVENYWHKTENKQSKWYKLAINAINAIASKKVYNQMCKWLNKEASFEGIEVSLEWDFWLSNPLYFKHAEPITQKEVDTYIKYIDSLSEEERYNDYLGLCRNTPLLVNMEINGEIDDDDDESVYNNWFIYFDKVFDTEYVLQTSIDRLEKERYYYNIKLDLEREKNPPKEKTPYVKKPYLSFEIQKSLTDRYVKEFETYENKMGYEGFKWSILNNRFTEWVEGTIYELEEIEEYVAVTPNDDWREGLEIALEMYKRRKIIEAIPAAYEEYLYLLDNQLGFEDWLPLKEDLKAEVENNNEYKAGILEARKLLNEPENFDF